MTGDFPDEPTVEDTWDALRRRAKQARARSERLQEAYRATVSTTHARRERERAIADAARAGDLGAREALVQRYAPIVSGLARRRSRGSPARYAELLSAGLSALLDAIEAWDPSTRDRALENARAAIMAGAERRPVN